MTLTHNIFSLTNVSDVPQKMRPVKGKKNELLRQEVLKLFNIKDILTTQEICVGYYRAYKMEIPKTKIYAALTNLANRKHLLKKGVGVYQSIIPAKDSIKSIKEKIKKAK